MQSDFRSQWLAVEPLASVVDQWYALKQGSSGFYQFYKKAWGLRGQLPDGQVTDESMLWHLWSHMDPHLMQVVASIIHNSSLNKMVQICSFEDKFRVRSPKPTESGGGADGGRKNRYGKPYGGQQDGALAPKPAVGKDGTDGMAPKRPRPAPRPGGANTHFHVPDLAYNQCKYCLKKGHWALACTQRLAGKPRTMPPEPKKVNAVMWAGTADESMSRLGMGLKRPVPRTWTGS